MTFAVTTSLVDRLPALGAPESAIIIDALQWLRRERWARVYAFAVMPDHVHVIAQPIDGRLIDAVMKNWKNISARRINQLRGAAGKLWQSGFYDHAIRDDEEFGQSLAYIHQNPVAAGFVARADEWWASSAHADWKAKVDTLDW